MAIACPVGFDSNRLREEVSFIYARVANDPQGDFHFHRGPTYAAEWLRYDPAVLARIPAESTAAFAGVANPHRAGSLSAGETVVDVGCGGGMDLLVAALRVGPSGRAIGVDMTAAMADRARSSAKAMGLEQVEVRAGDAESLPIDDASVDAVMSNGVINLTTDKHKAFSEIFRVLRPGGRLLLADIVVREELSEKIRNDIDLWTG